MRLINPAPGLVPYVACAAIAAFALNYCMQSVQVGLNAPERIAAQSEVAQSTNFVDRSHKSDSFSNTQRIYGQATAGSLEVGNPGVAPVIVPRRGSPPSLGHQPELPDGCESAFSPLSAAEQKDFAARCLT